MSDFVTVLNAVIPVFGITGIGVLLQRLKWISESADQALMRLTINVLMPGLIFDSVLRNQALRKPGTLFLAIGLGFGTITLGLLVCWLFRKAADPKNETVQRTFTFCTAIFNYGYVPLPLAIFLFPHYPETVGVLLVFGVGVDLCIWTLGVLVLTGHPLRDGWRKLLSAPLVAITIALMLNLTGVSDHIPAAILNLAKMLGQAAFPVAILLIGAVIGRYLGEFGTFSGWRVFAWACALRLVLLPCAFLALARWLPCGPELKAILVLEAAMPGGMFPIVITRHYGGDTPTALRVVLGTSLVGLLSIPFWVRLGIQFVNP